MHFVEPVEHAPQWVRDHARTMRSDARFVAVVTVHDPEAAGRYPALRDRTEESVAMLRGLVGDLGAEVARETRVGRDWSSAGFTCEGAQCVRTLRMLVA